MGRGTMIKEWVAGILVLILGGSMSACATGAVGLGGDSWKEQALQYDGSAIIVERSQDYGGRSEIGQGAPIRDYRLTFTLPGAGQSIEWKSDYSEDVGRANLHPLALHVLDGTPYVISEPNLCLAYNKWGRPNPPYVVFKYDGGQWQRITIGQLPPEFRDMNLVNDTKDEARQLVQAGQVSAEEVKRLNREITQPEYKTILREALPKERINQMCMEMVPYKGSWVMPNDPIARKFIDLQKRHM